MSGPPGWQYSKLVEPLSTINCTWQWLPFPTNYRLTCKSCDTSPEPKNQLIRTEATLKGSGCTALANLHVQNPEANGIKTQDVQAFVKNNVSLLNLKGSKSELGVVTSLYYKSIDQVHREGEKNDCLFWLIQPLNEITTSAPAAKTKKAAKRTTVTDVQIKLPKRAKQGATHETYHTFTLNGFRYYAAELDRVILPPYYRIARAVKDVQISPRDRAQQLTVSKDGKTVTGHKGYCSGRASHSVGHGSWYWEVTVLEPEKREGLPDGHVRLGISQESSDVQFPTGYDAFSYSWRDIQGSKFHKSRGQECGPSDGFGPGDTLGFYLELEPQGSSTTMLTQSIADPCVTVESKAYFEYKIKKNEDTIKRVPKSRLLGYKNGTLIGEIASDLLQGRWYPAVSLYYGARVSINFGPTFKHPPSDVSYRPFSDAMFMTNAELTINDIINQIDGTNDAILSKWKRK